MDMEEYNKITEENSKIMETIVKLSEEKVKELENTQREYLSKINVFKEIESLNEAADLFEMPKINIDQQKLKRLEEEYNNSYNKMQKYGKDMPGMITHNACATYNKNAKNPNDIDRIQYVIETMNNMYYIKEIQNNNPEIYDFVNKETDKTLKHPYFNDKDNIEKMNVLAEDLKSYMDFIIKAKDLEKQGYKIDFSKDTNNFPRVCTKYEYQLKQLEKIEKDNNNKIVNNEKDLIQNKNEKYVTMEISKQKDEPIQPTKLSLFQKIKNKFAGIFRKEEKKMLNAANEQTTEKIVKKDFKQEMRVPSEQSKNKQRQQQRVQQNIQRNMDSREDR